jgi:hypothetical protein
VPVTGVFPAGVYLHLLETGIQAIQLSPYRADLPARRPCAWARLPVSWHAIFPGHPFRARSAIRSRDISSQSLPAARAIQQCASWRTRSVKPSAKPTLVRTQHLPPAKPQRRAPAGDHPAGPKTTVRRTAGLAPASAVITAARSLTCSDTAQGRSCRIRCSRAGHPFADRHGTQLAMIVIVRRGS